MRQPRRGAPIARIAAPIALLVVTVAVIAIVGGAGGDGGEGADAAAGSGGGGNRGAETTERSPSRPKNYVVQPGDSLSSIADEFGISVERIQRLNEDVDPQALATGEKLKLR